MNPKVLARPCALATLAAVALVVFSSLAAAQTRLFRSGTEDDAAAYYERISGILSLQVDDMTLSDLVAYLGHGDVSAANLESGVAADLFDAGDVLATRYMASRIVDISGAPPYQAGWRKLVKLKARSGSDAENSGIAAAYFLFDYLRPQDDPEPFPGPDALEDRGAKSIQVMVMPRTGTEPGNDSAYFMLFEGASAQYASTRFTAGNFDLPPDPKTEGRFYVPSACGRCHGDVGHPSDSGINMPTAKLNFLDTDYWTDQIQPGDHFADAGTLHGILFDGGPDVANPAHAAAYDVVRTFNVEIEEQNRRAPTLPNDPNYALQGVQKWLELHESSDSYAQPIERALGEPEERWSTEIPEDPQLIAMLSKHCYRCHNTIDFNVFLKPRFAGVAKSSISSVMFSIMPFGHSLLVHEPGEADIIMDGLNKLLERQAAKYR